MRIGICGGGMAGVTLARFLAKAHQVTILEGEAEPGGLVRSFPFRGFWCDVGPHILFSKNERVLAQMLALDPEGLREYQRSNQIWYKGRLIKYPFENYLGLLPAGEAAHCLETFLHNPHEDYEPRNMLQFFLRTFGAGITETYLRPYNEKIWKYDPAFLDLQMVGRIPKPPVEDVISGARGDFKEGYVHQARFYYPRCGGIQAFFERAVAALPANARLLAGHLITDIARCGNGWMVRCENGTNLEFDGIINCMPLHELFGCLRLDIPEAVRQALARLRYNSMFYGMAVFRRDAAGHNFSLNIPQREVLFHRISKMNFLADAGESGFLFEITFQPGSALANCAPERLTREILDGFEFMNLARREDLVDIEIRSVKYAYVIYDLPHRRNADTVFDFLRSAGIPCCGRFAEFEYLNMDQIFERATALAEHLNDGWNCG